MIFLFTDNINLSFNLREGNVFGILVCLSYVNVFLLELNYKMTFIEMIRLHISDNNLFCLTNISSCECNKVVSAF